MPETRLPIRLYLDGAGSNVYRYRRSRRGCRQDNGIPRGETGTGYADVFTWPGPGRVDGDGGMSLTTPDIGHDPEAERHRYCFTAADTADADRVGSRRCTAGDTERQRGTAGATG